MADKNDRGGWRRNSWTTIAVVGALLVAFLIWGVSYYGGGLATDELAPSAADAPTTEQPVDAFAAGEGGPGAADDQAAEDANASVPAATD